MNDTSPGLSVRKRPIRPICTTPSTGQNSSSASMNTFRVASWKLRTAKAQAATSSIRHAGASVSARELNEHLLEIRFADLDVAHGHAIGLQRAQQLRQSLL